MEGEAEASSWCSWCLLYKQDSCEGLQSSVKDGNEEKKRRRKKTPHSAGVGVGESLSGEFGC